MNDLNNKIAIVTGSSRGIGRAIANRLAQDGATVIINYSHSADKADAAVKEIEQGGGKAIAIQADVSQVTDLERLFDDAIAFLCSDDARWITGQNICVNGGLA